MNKFKKIFRASLLQLCFIHTSTLLQLCFVGVSQGQVTTDRKNATLIRVIDGDTYLLQVGPTRQTVRLLNVDCPELGQVFGPEAAQQARRHLAFSRQITLQTRKYPDKYGRALGHVWVDGKGLDSLLLVSGSAWVRQCGRNLKLRRLEHSARIRGMGLWKQKNPVPPWGWRKMSIVHSR
jgi:endonuclease YncB( thermonuclease family)